MKSESFLQPIDGDDDGVSCVVPTSAPSANVDIGGEDIHELSFPLVSPLSAQNNCD
jgi:hypothetical protein